MNPHYSPIITPGRPNRKGRAARRRFQEYTVVAGLAILAGMAIGGVCLYYF